MRRPRATISSARSGFAFLAIVAWFSLSNHCALGSALPGPAVVASAETRGCPMHTAPAKKKPAAKITCCKEVRAIVAQSVTASAPAPVTGSVGYAAEIFALPKRASIEVRALDTGPPGAFSFAESVLQESTLSHAPPVS